MFFWLSENEIVYITVTGRKGGKWSLLDFPKRKSVGWETRLSSDVSKPLEGTVDLFCSTCATLKACLECQGQQHFVGREADTDCYA